MSVEARVAAHYTRGNLGEAILAAAREHARDPARLTVGDLAPVDEFHIGGVEATGHFLPKLGIGRASRWLDVGAGIGGPARQAAVRFGCHVTGVDLTPEFCAVGTQLTAAVGLGDCVRIEQANALSMPFDDASFDGAYTIHVAMNIEDKPGLYREVHRVLRPGAVFGIYDILAGAEGGALHYPVPWAATPDESFLVSIDGMIAMLGEAGFELLSREDRTDYAKSFFERLRQQAASGAPPLGLHLVMGETFREKVSNMVRNVAEGRCGPWEIVCRKR